MPAKTETAWLIERDDIAALRLDQIIPNSDPVETAGEVVTSVESPAEKGGE